MAHHQVQTGTQVMINYYFYYQLTIIINYYKYLCLVTGAAGLRGGGQPQPPRVLDRGDLQDCLVRGDNNARCAILIETLRISQCPESVSQ